MRLFETLSDTLSSRGAIGLGVVLTAFFLFRGFAGVPVAEVNAHATSVRPTTLDGDARYSFSNIEDIRVGQRVITNVPNGILDLDGRPFDSSLPEGATRVDPATWRLVRMQAMTTWEDGTVDDINIETLQPPEWLATHQIVPGAMAPIPLDLVEMGLPAGLRANVLAIQPCPAIACGRGRVVLTTVNHLNSYVFDVATTDGFTPLSTFGVTGSHRIYSDTHASWLTADSASVGECVNALSGSVMISRVSRRPGTHRVFNITVEGEHVYRISTEALLVHNVCPWHQWNIGPHALKPDHNWAKLLGQGTFTLDDIKPFVQRVLENATGWVKVGESRGEGGEIIGEILEANYNGVWVRAFKDKSGRIIVNNAGAI